MATGDWQSLLASTISGRNRKLEFTEHYRKRNIHSWHQSQGIFYKVEIGLKSTKIYFFAVILIIFCANNRYRRGITTGAKVSMHVEGLERSDGLLGYSWNGAGITKFCPAI